jgi:hypothetical protein
VRSVVAWTECAEGSVLLRVLLDDHGPAQVAECLMRRRSRRFVEAKG